MLEQSVRDCIVAWPPARLAITKVQNRLWRAKWTVRQAALAIDLNRRLELHMDLQQL